MMFRQQEAKEPVKLTLVSEAPPKEWGLTATDKITNAFYIANRKIICVKDGDEDVDDLYLLKIIKDDKVTSIEFPFDVPCCKIIAYSENLLLCIPSFYHGKKQFADTGYTLLDINKNSFIDTKRLSPVQVVGFVKSEDQEDILVILHDISISMKPKPKNTSFTKKIADTAGEVKDFFHEETKIEELNNNLSQMVVHNTLSFYKFDESRSRLQLFNTIETYLDKVAIDCDGRHLIGISTRLNSNCTRYRVNKMGQLNSVFCGEIPADFQSSQVDVVIPNIGYIQLLRILFNSMIQILDKNFKAMASCPSSIRGVKKVHALSDGKTFVVEHHTYQESDLTTSLGIFKLTEMGELNMTLHLLPFPCVKTVIDEKEAQLICFENWKGKVAVINSFAPLLDFVAIDKELDESSDAKLPTPLRGMVTAYLGNPGTMKLG